MLEGVRGLISGDLTHVGLAFMLAAALARALGFWALRGLRSAEAAG